MKQPTKRGISYRRVSTDEQAATGFSLPTQLKEIQAYCAKNGIELVSDFCDDFTGSSLERPGLIQARKWLKAGRADCFICLDSDRLTREPAHYMMLRDELNGLGVELHYSKRGHIDLNDFGAMVSEDIFGRFAFEWKRKLVEATTRGRRGKAEAGNVIVHGRPPYGYQLGECKGKAMLLINEPEAKIVRTIYHLYVFRDMGYRAIADHLTGLKVLTRADDTPQVPSFKKQDRGCWSIATIQRILTGEVYKGIWHYSKVSGNPIEIKLPAAIIGADVWDMAQRKRESNTGGRLSAKYEYLLSGRGKCDRCGSPMIAQSVKWTSKNANGVTLFYRCSSTCGTGRVGVKCDAPTFHARRLDFVVWQWIKGLLLDRQRLEDGLKRYQERAAGKAEPIKADLARLDMLIAKKQNRLDRARNLYLEGEEEKAVFLAEKKNLESDIAGLAAQRAELQSQLDNCELSPEAIADIYALAEQVREGLELLEDEPDFPLKRRIINRLDVRVRLTVEEKQKVIYASCVLDPNALLALPSDYTSLEKPRWSG